MTFTTVVRRTRRRADAPAAPPAGPSARVKAARPILHLKSAAPDAASDLA